MNPISALIKAWDEQTLLIAVGVPKEMRVSFWELYHIYRYDLTDYWIEQYLLWKGG